MSSKKGRGTGANSPAQNLASSAAPSAKEPVKPTELEYCAKFLHGSPDSRDRDCVYLIDPSAPFPSHTTLVDFCKSDIEDRNVIQLGQENAETGGWYVQRSHRGPPDEVNNALIETHRNDPDGPSYEFLIRHKACRSVILRYVIASKAIIVKMRRIEACRTECLAALASWSFSSYLHAVHASCAPQFSTLTLESAKYVAFHLAQSYLLSNGLESYTKRDLVNYLPELKPIIYFEGNSDDSISSKCSETIKTLEERWISQTSRIFASPPLDKRLRLQSFHLALEGGPIVAKNYLEVDCAGTVVDMLSERLVAIGSPIPLQLPLSETESSSTAPGYLLQSSPSWPNDIILLKAGQTAIQPVDYQRIVFGFVEGKWRAFNDMTLLNGSNQVNSNSKGKLKASSSKVKPSSPDEATQAIIKSVLDRLAALPIRSFFSLSVDIARGKIIAETARSSLTLLEMKL